MIIAARKEWFLKYIALVLAIAAVALLQLYMDNNELRRETEHYKQLAMDNCETMIAWHQEAVNWKVLFYHIPEQYRDWIILNEEELSWNGQ